MFEVGGYRKNIIFTLESGSSSSGRVSASQAEGGGFESRLPLQETNLKTIGAKC